jgi:hypothetical protein
MPAGALHYGRIELITNMLTMFTIMIPVKMRVDLAGVSGG